MKRKFLKASLAGIAFAIVGFTPLANAQDKGLIAISMPTKSSARWIADGANMVKTSRTRATRPTCSTPTTTSPTSSRRSRTW